MEQNRIIYLHQGYLNQKLTIQELKEWKGILDDPQNEPFLKELMKETWEELKVSGTIDMPQERAESLFLEIAALPQEVVKRRLWPRFVAVAAAMALIVSGVYFFNYRNDQTDAGLTSALVHDAKPGKVGATLTLADGKKIRLDDAVNGELANEAGVSISKSADGQLVYEIKGGKGNPDRMNTLSTAKGETYKVRLPDGSLVYLNAASSLTYAASVNERGKRVVRLSGEGYFQVAKDKAHPFVVKTDKQEVEVLGTHFNVSAYENDPQIKTTLEEGSIKIAFGSESRILKPNQQAVLSGANIQVTDVDAELALAWKSGFFLFDREPLESIMNKLERWYEVDVIYSDPSLKTRIFTGTISRFEKISEVLNMLESTEGVRFKIEDRKVIISKRN